MANRPYGNDFIVQTPALDQLQTRIYNEQRQRELYQQQQNQMLDNEFSKNLAGIKDADIGELTQKYGDFKMAYQNMLKQKNGVTPEQQLDVLRKKADVYSVINRSKTQKASEDEMAKQINSDRKGYYADDAQQKLINIRNTPTSKLNGDEFKQLLYPYSMPDLNTELKNAQGQTKEVQVPIGVNKDDPMKDDTEVYKVGNSANQFYNNLLQGVVASNKGRNFAGIVNNKYDDQGYANLKDAYNAIVTNPKYIAIHGQQQPLNDNTDLSKAVATETMENVVNNPLIPSQVKSETNAGRKMAAEQAFQLKKQAIGHQNSLENISTQAYYNNKDPQVIDKNVDAIIQKHLDNSKSLNGEVPMSAATFKALTGEVLTPRTVVKIDDNGNYTYGKREVGTDGKPTGNILNEKTVPYGEAKDRLTKDLKAGLSAKNQSGSTAPNPSIYTIKGKQYSEKSLLNMGYKLEDIAPYKNK